MIRLRKERVLNMIEIHIYGNLRKYAQDFATPGKSQINLEPDPGENIASLLNRIRRYRKCN